MAKMASTIALYPNTGLRGHQCRHGFVLDLVQSSDGCASRWIAVSEEAPAARQSLGVLCVPAEHPHLQRAPVHVVADKQRRADSLPLRNAQVLHLDAQRSERVAHALDARHACCRSEREPNDGTCRETECEAGRCAGR